MIEDQTPRKSHDMTITLIAYHIILHITSYSIAYNMICNMIAYNMI